METNKFLLGKKGEIFVLNNLLKNGWNLHVDESNDLKNIDWIVYKKDRIIRIQVKASNKIRPTFSFHSKSMFDYLIFTDLKDCWIIPSAILKSTDKVSTTIKKLKNKYNLLNLNGLELLKELNDCGISFGEISTTDFFK